jgi:hypothetical protein
MWVWVLVKVSYPLSIVTRFRLVVLEFMFFLQNLMT